MTRYLALFAFLASVGFAQTDPPPLDFEAASVKPYVPQSGSGPRMAFGRRGGPGSNDPGRITWNGATLKSLIASAYALRTYQVTGPSWIETERYNIVAKVPAGATREQVNVMCQRLLADRFQLQFHRETRDLPVYDLVVAKGGPKLKPSEPPPDPPKDAAPKPAPPPGAPVRPTIGPDGCPIFPDGRGGSSMTMMPGRFQLCARDIDMDGLAGTLTGQLATPVFNKTGLAGKFVFKLEFEPEAGGMMGPASGGPIANASQSGAPREGPSGSSAPNFEPAPPITTAVQTLGLKLEAKKVPTEMLIVDKAEKTPVEN
jgi:uncharacterized protein (TIGR03435 family)